MSTEPAGLIETRHYLGLDGLRGVAAMAVVLLHGSLFFGSGSQIRETGLAVDFFFVLSGFVLSGAYGVRLGTIMPLRYYVLRRIIRLYPMILLGVAVGVLALLFAQRGLGTIQNLHLVGPVLCGILAIPTLHAFQNWHWPLDPPEWSLTYEIGASLVFGVWAKILKLRFAEAALLLSLGPFIFERINDQVLSHGWIFILSQGARVTFPFLLGVVIERCRIQLTGVKVRATALAIALFITFLPRISAPYEIICDCLIYPVIVMLALNQKPTAFEARWLAISGRLSYPIYLLHWPIFEVVTSWGKPRGHIAVAAAFGGAVALTVGVSLVALAIYDEPVRQKLDAWASRYKRSGRGTHSDVGSLSG